MLWNKKDKDIFTQDEITILLYRIRHYQEWIFSKYKEEQEKSDDYSRNDYCLYKEELVRLSRIKNKLESLKKKED